MPEMREMSEGGESVGESGTVGKARDGRGRTGMGTYKRHAAVPV